MSSRRKHRRGKRPREGPFERALPPAPKRPYIVRRNGELVDRGSGQIVGAVWLEAGVWHNAGRRLATGWYANTLDGREFGPMGTRWFAARQAWEAATKDWPDDRRE